MFSVIIMACGEPTGWWVTLSVAVMVTVPVEVPARNPVSETPTLIGEVAERLTLPEGEALSHDPPVEVATAADQFNELLQAPLALMVAGCVVGSIPPTRPAKVRATGVAAIAHAGETVKVTGIDCGLPVATCPEPSVPVIVIVPV